MKVLALILVIVGAVGAVGATTAPAPAAIASPYTTATPTSTALPDTLGRPLKPRTHPAPVVAPAKPPHPAAVKAPKVVKKAVVRTHTATPVRARTATVVAGIKPSAYRGSYYDARYESFRRCVVKRESNGRYTARNPNSSASGAYQFLAAWTRTIQKWTGEHVPIYRMSRYAQDLAFWRALDHGRGASNWAGGNYSC